MAGPLTLPSFPSAEQAQIIRAHQRDLYHVSSLKDRMEAVLRSWLGTRWLSRWDKEVDLIVKLVYYGLTTGRATQTLGEEYTDIWQHSAFTSRLPSLRTRVALILLPTLPSYIFARWGSGSAAAFPSRVTTILHALPAVLETAAELNLAIFYLKGTYYNIAKRVLGIRHRSSLPKDPHTRPPSYALLGVLLGIRLTHRLILLLRRVSQKNGQRSNSISEIAKGKQRALNTHETFLDSRPVSDFLGSVDPESEPARPAEEDKHTALDITSISLEQRAGRNCTLCLEERTDSCATECGHLFCWSCIVGWGREKAECPLCRQALNLTRLLPVYNL